MITSLENISYEMMNKRTGFNSTRRETTEDTGAFQWVKDCFERTGVSVLHIFYESLQRKLFNLQQ